MLLPPPPPLLVFQTVRRLGGPGFAGEQIAPLPDGLMPLFFLVIIFFWRKTKQASTNKLD